MLKKIFAFLLILFACVALSWGNITVGGETNPELAGLNRDIDNVQEITKDKITGSLDASMTVDNRILTESGRDQIAEQHEDFVDNAIIAGVGAYGTVEGAAKFVGDAVGLGEKEYDKNGNEVETSAIDKWKANQSGMATGIRRGGSEAAQQIIKNMSEGFVSPEDLQKLAAMTADGSVNLVYSNNQENVVFLDASGNVIGVIARDGFNDLTNNQGYVNLANGAGTDAYTFLRTDAEERAHNYVGSSETAASAAANNEMSYYNAVAGLTGGYTVAPGQYGAGLGTNAQSQYNQQYNGATNTLLYTNNVNASSVTGPTADSRTVLGATNGAILGGAAGTVVPGVGNTAGAIGGALIFGGLGLYEDVREYMNSGETWENMPEEMRANYSSKEAFQARGVVSLGLSRLENESEMLKSATLVPVDGPVYDPWTGEELPMSGFVYQVGNEQYYTGKQLSEAIDGNYNAQAWAWTEIGLTGASATASAAGATIKGINALKFKPLYRAVSSEEATSIVNTGKFTIPAGGAEGKYFSTSYKELSNYVNTANSNGVASEVPYTAIYKTKIPKSTYKTIEQSGDVFNDYNKLPSVFIREDYIDSLSAPKLLK